MLSFLPLFAVDLSGLVFTSVMTTDPKNVSRRSFVPALSLKQTAELQKFPSRINVEC
jgi:hypothetical protein